MNLKNDLYENEIISHNSSNNINDEFIVMNDEQNEFYGEKAFHSSHGSHGSHGSDHGSHVSHGHTSHVSS